MIVVHPKLPYKKGPELLSIVLLIEQMFLKRDVTYLGFKKPSRFIRSEESSSSNKPFRGPFTHLAMGTPNPFFFR
jgi:hypothetical protein